MPSKRKEKNSLLLYYNYKEQFDELTDKQLRQLIYAMIEYDQNEKELELDTITKMAFIPIKRQLKQDKELYISKCNKNKQNIEQRWNNKDTNVYDRIRMDTNDTDKDNDNDNDNDNDKDNENDNDKNNIYFFIEENFGRMLSPIEYQEISTWEDNELTRYAIKQAVLNGKYNIKYIARILDNFKKNNIVSVQQAEQESIKYKSRGDKKETSWEYLERIKREYEEEENEKTRSG